MERVCVFVDGSNFNFGLKANNCETRLNYYELSKALAGPDRELVRTFYYNSDYAAPLTPEQCKEHVPILDALMRTPQLEMRPILPVEGVTHGGGSMVMLASELVFHAARGLYDTAILVTSDAFIAPAMAHAKALGPHVEVALFWGNYPRELVQVADRIIPINEVLTMYRTQIFQEVPEEDDNIGNRIEDEPVAKKQVKRTVKRKTKSKI